MPPDSKAWDLSKVPEMPLPNHDRNEPQPDELTTLRARVKELAELVEQKEAEIISWSDRYRAMSRMKMGRAK